MSFLQPKTKLNYQGRISGHKPLVSRVVQKTVMISKCSVNSNQLALYSKKTYRLSNCHKIDDLWLIMIIPAILSISTKICKLVLAVCKGSIQLIVQMLEIATLSFASFLKRTPCNCGIVPRLLCIFLIKILSYNEISRGHIHTLNS